MVKNETYSRKIPLSITDGKDTSISQFFLNLLTWYAPPPKQILDMACGEKIMYEDLITFNNTEQYKFTFSDIKEDCGEHTWNILDTPWKYNNKSFDVFVLDLPFPNLNENYSRFDKYGGYISNSEFVSMLLSSRDEAFRILRDDGIFILKIQDTFNSVNKEYMPLHINTHNTLSEKFKIFDTLIYRYWNNKAALRHRYKKVQPCLNVHTYHMIYKKKVTLI